MSNSIKPTPPKPPCSVKDCARIASTRGMCSKHYQQLRKGQIPGPSRIRGPTPIPLLDRLWARVNKDGPIPEYAPHLGNCWFWLGAKTEGYGCITVTSGHLALVHRLTYVEARGPIPNDLVLDHLCRIRHCCRPSHLEAVTYGENNRRGFGSSGLNAKKTHCKWGHAFSLENTKRTEAGTRRCLTCRQEYSRGKRAAKPR